MATLLTNARLIDPAAGTQATGWLLFDETGILERGTDAPPAIHDDTFDASGACVAPGIIDIGVKIGEPGERHKESYKTAGAAAAAGGVTTIVTRPDTTPVTDTPETLAFAMRRAAETAPVHVLPMAALTKGFEGREMTEIGFLRDAGAVAFSDADRPVQNPKVLLR
ncbi:MAG: dihydroorotase, partial [Pseudomonadota bacterium]